MRQETKTCQNCKHNFAIEPEDFSFYEKMDNVIPPVDCPVCRFKKRAVWRNETCLYNRKCDATGKNIISVYHPNSPYTVYSLDYYFSEEWDPRDFAQEYDHEQDFFTQFKELLTKVPKKGLYAVLGLGENINSDYVNFAGGCKDAYLCFNTAYVENVLYTKGLTNSRDSLDIYYADSLEHCYESVNGYANNHVSFDRNSRSCINCTLIENCQNCNDCFGCINLRNKSYCFFNEQLTKEDYQEQIKKYQGSRTGMQEAIDRFEKHRLQYPHRINQNINAVQSTGNYIFNTKNCQDCFEVGDGENVKYSIASRQTKDSYDNFAGIGLEQSLENLSGNHSNFVIGTVGPENSKNCFYSFGLRNCSDCFGCDGLENAQYCILNKQYSKEDYEALKNHIVTELREKGIYGHMIPPEIAPFGYNETTAYDNFPLTKEEALAQGFHWQDEIQVTKGKQTISQTDVPDHINNVDDTIVNEVLACDTCDRNYKITAPELTLHRQIKAPIPNNCFFCRHKARIEKRGPYTLIDRTCDNCQKSVKTTARKEVSPIIYCEECYQKEVL